MPKASKNIKEDLAKNRPSKLAPIINTVMSFLFLVLLIVVKCISDFLSWPLFFGFLIVIILFPCASWYNSYFSKKQKTKMLYNYEKETERIVEFLQNRKHYKLFEENEKINVSATYTKKDISLNYTYNKDVSSLGFPNHDYTLMSIGIGFAGVEIDPKDQKIIGVAGLLPRSIWLKKNLKTPTPTVKGEITVHTKGVELRNKTYLQINKQADTYYNQKTGWLCIGEYKTYAIDDIVEFMDNAYLVIQDEKIISLWLYVGLNLPLY